MDYLKKYQQLKRKTTSGISAPETSENEKKSIKETINVYQKMKFGKKTLNEAFVNVELLQKIRNTADQILSSITILEKHRIGRYEMIEDDVKNLIELGNQINEQISDFSRTIGIVSSFKLL